MDPCISSSVCKSDLAFWGEHYRVHDRLTPTAVKRELAVLACAVEFAHTTHSHVAKLFQENMDFEAVAEGVRRFLPNVTIAHHTWAAIPKFGEYNAQQNEIILYPHTLERFAAHLFSSPVPLPVICLAHEFFHALEHNTVGDTRKHILMRLGRLTAWRTIVYRHADEVAAHTFARRLLSLKTMPVL